MVHMIQHRAPRCPRCGEAPSGRDPIDIILREAIRDLDSEITAPSTLGASIALVKHVRDRLADALEHERVELVVQTCTAQRGAILRADL